MKKILLATAAIASGVVFAQGAVAATETANITAAVAPAISITKNQDMSFGTFTVNGGGSDTTVYSDGTTAALNGTTIGGAQDAAFVVSGDQNQTFELQLTSIGTLFTNTPTLTVTGAAAVGAGNALTGGSVAFGVTGELVVPEGSTGSDSATFTAEVNYD